MSNAIFHSRLLLNPPIHYIHTILIMLLIFIVVDLRLDITMSGLSMEFHV